MKRSITHEETMYFTLGQAAKKTGISKATISRDIKKGKLSAERQGACKNNGMKIGYARVSTDEQNLDLQRQALQSADRVREIDKGDDNLAFDATGRGHVLFALYC